jgi:hypothetical protein
MLRGPIGAASGTLAFLLAGCASFQVVSDPRIGALSRERLPILIKSVRCELATFYTADLEHKHRLSARRIELARSGARSISLEEVAALNHFDLDIDAYSNFTLDVKVQDSLGIPGTSTSVNSVLNATAGHTRNLALGPSVQVQATYDNAAQFAIPQNASIVTPHPISVEQASLAEAVRLPAEDMDFKCFSRSVIDDYDGMAAGHYPNLELFERIRVDAGSPLAAWMQEASRTMGVSRNLMLDAHADAEHRPPVPVEDQYIAQAVDVGQLVYTFSVQYTGGLDAKFSLVSSRFNPLAADLSAGVQQTGSLTLYLNGYQTITAINAKGGLVGIYPSPKVPLEVVIVDGKHLPAAAPTKTAEAPAKTVGPAGQRFIRSFVEKKGAEPQLLDNLMKELGKNQNAAGQPEMTNQAIQNLNIPDKEKENVKQKVEEKSVTQPVQPRVQFRRQPRNYDATRQNDGRGYLRVPLGISVQ